MATTVYADGDYELRLFEDGCGGGCRLPCLWLKRGSRLLGHWASGATLFRRRRDIGTLVRHAIATMATDREQRREVQDAAQRAVEEARQDMAIEAEIMQAVRAAGRA